MNSEPHDAKAAFVKWIASGNRSERGVFDQPENVTMASVTFQNYFRLYDKLAGMTGTAATEAEEFSEIYKLGVVEVPTNKTIAPMTDEDDQNFIVRHGKRNTKPLSHRDQKSQ